MNTTQHNTTQHNTTQHWTKLFLALFSIITLSIPLSALAQTIMGTTQVSGSGVSGNGPTYSKCYSSENQQTRFYPDLYYFSHYVSTGAIRVRYDLQTTTGSTVYSFEAAPYEDWGTYYYTVDNQVVEGLVHPNFAKIIPVNNQYYKIKITIRKGSSVGFWANLTGTINNWDHVVATYETNPSRVQLKDANPQFTLTSQIGTDAGGRPISCASDVRINGSASTCETVYYLEVTETDQWWNHSFPPADFAGAWLPGPVPSVIDLQWFCTNYGNPIDGDPVNGVVPSGYDGFLMRERPYPGNLTPNFYRIKLVTFQNAWKEKNLLIDVDGSCKTGSPNLAFDPNSMVPMTQEELDVLFKRHGNPIAEPNLIAQQVELSDITLYPNPAKNYCTITSSQPVSAHNIILTDLFGNSFNCSIQQVDNNNLELNTENLKSGLYIIIIQFNDQLIREKLWVE